MVGRAIGRGTTSEVAGALWFPFLCEPPERVNGWARETYMTLARLAVEHPEAGVDLLTHWETVSDASEPWWAAALPMGVTRELVERGPLNASSPAWRFRVPRVDPTVFLPWCIERLKKWHVEFQEREVSSLAGLVEEERSRGVHVVVNCSGLGAASLCGDTAMQARAGQMVVVEPGAWPLDESAADERTSVCYVVPRRRGVLLGGSSEIRPSDAAARVDAAVRAQILGMMEKRGVAHGGVIDDLAGLRPWRPSVRIEQDAALRGVIHNYGHGGAGWTLSFGCAMDVVKLAEEISGGAGFSSRVSIETPGLSSRGPLGAGQR